MDYFAACIVVYLFVAFAVLPAIFGGCSYKEAVKEGFVLQGFLSAFVVIMGSVTIALMTLIN